MEKLNSTITSLQQKLILINGLTESAIGLMMNCAVVSLLIYGIKIVNSGRMDGVYLSVIVLGVMASFEALLPLPLAFQNLSKSVQAASRLFEIIDSGDKPAQKTFKSESLENFDIEFNNVIFTYDDVQVLNKVSFIIRQGKKIGITGKSGAGKSTIVNLLLRFWQPDAGEIRLGEQNISELDEIFLRDRISVMNQDYFLFNRTLQDNLLLANASAADDHVQRVISRCNLQDTVNTLPDGFNTRLGEQGYNLSGGERQRLCLARTLLKNAAVYVFDEPSTNLDSENERIIFDSIYNIAGDKSVLIITHKLKYLRQADYIYYFDEGMIKEEGTFDELIKMDGLFKSVFALQHQIIDFSPE
jgi:ABC-type multidrug transport system fused ATPase/permease subunit